MPSNDYAAMPLEELRARFAVRVLGWTWWRSQRDQLAALMPPADSGRVRWNFSPEVYDELTGEEWPTEQFVGGVRNLYDDNERWQPRIDGPPALFRNREHPHPAAWWNVGRVLEAMRERGYLVELIGAKLADDAPRPPYWQAAFYSKGDAWNIKDPDPERAALVAALLATDAESKAKQGG